MGHPIDELTVHALRKVHDLHRPQLGRFNLLVGENNSGKSTALEAIAPFCRPLDPLDLAGRCANGFLDGVRWLFPQDPGDQDDPSYHGEILIDAGHCREHSAEPQEKREGSDRPGASQSLRMYNNRCCQDVKGGAVQSTGSVVLECQTESKKSRRPGVPGAPGIRKR